MTRNSAPRLSSFQTTIPDYSAGPQASPHQPSPTPNGNEPRAGWLAATGRNTLVIGAVAGAAAGLIAATVSRIPSGDSIARQDLRLGLLVILAASILGFMQAGWADLSSGATAKGLARGALGIALGTGAALVGLLLADIVNDSLISGADDVERAQRIALLFGWFIVGSLTGLGVGASVAMRKAVLGLIGGSFGGLIGGLVAAALNAGPDAGLGPLLLAVPLAAMSIGVAVGGAERIGRQRWIVLVGGPLAGREVLFYGTDVTIGSGGRNDFTLTGDGVSQRHLRATFDSAGATLSPRSDSYTLVHGQPVANAIRVDAQTVVQVGPHSMTFHAD